MTSYIKQGDCLELMREIPDHSVDMILCDPPYGILNKSNPGAKWDSVLDIDEMWSAYTRIIKENGAIVLFGSGLFTARCMLSQPKLWKYNLIWDKVLTSGFLNANRMPLRRHEDIMVFYKKPPVYNPQKVPGKPNHGKGSVTHCVNHNYGSFKPIDNKDALGDMKFPTSLLCFEKTHPSKSVHPTQKPVALLEWLIRTYTNEGDTVLDNCMGSGSTCVAARNTNRNYIGFELDEKYFRIASERIMPLCG